MEMTIEKRNKFINNNMGIIGLIADTSHKNCSTSYTNLAKGKGYSRSDIINCGVVGMIEAINRFDESRGVPLEAFVKIDIHRRISEFIAKPRKHDRAEFKVSMQSKISNTNGDSVTVEDMFASKTTENSFGINIDIAIMRKILASNILSEVERMVVKMRFLEDMKFKHMDIKIRKFLNNSKARSFYFLNTGLEKLQKALT